MKVQEKLNWSPVWTIRKYQSEESYKNNSPFEISTFKGNVLLKAGITLLLDLLAGAGGTAYNNANTYIGVGDDNTAADDDQTGLIAATNKFWNAMEATYPQVSNQTITFRSVFATDEGNYDWREFTVVNASTDSGTNLNRVVSTQGTKASGQVWTVDVAITVS